MPVSWSCQRRNADSLTKEKKFCFDPLFTSFFSTIRIQKVGSRKVKILIWFHLGVIEYLIFG